jgi:deoxyribodipyrimidine photo-lyase
MKSGLLTIEHERVRNLNDLPTRQGTFVLYWMQSSQRVAYNHALVCAIEQANVRNLPLVVAFALTVQYPGANVRHLRFMLEGLDGVAEELRGRDIPFVIRPESPEACIPKLAEDASLLITDRGYLKTERQWVETVAERVRCRMIQVESNVIVPVETASPKEEYSAATFRPKITGHIRRFIRPVTLPELRRGGENQLADAIEFGRPDDLLEQMNPDRSVSPVRQAGGEKEAHAYLDTFIRNRLDGYNEERNDPGRDATSHLSAFLHFGQISPLEIAIRVIDAESPGGAAFLEELIVRRELAMNFVWYNPAYDRFDGLPEWAKKTLDKHRSDPREYTYPVADLEYAQTHDPFWNAAQNQMRLTGLMHSYMRMYWGKKILEWSPVPEEAYQTALLLNNRYELDGRDPNSYAGVAWCFGKHDRPWQERTIFGMVRYMNAAGLERKFNMEFYLKRVESGGETP